MYDLPTCLTKFLAMGMPLADCIAAATHTPAKALHLVDEGRNEPLGQLGVGAEADIAVFELQTVDVWLEDTIGQCVGHSFYSSAL